MAGEVGGMGLRLREAVKMGKWDPDWLNEERYKSKSIKHGGGRQGPCESKGYPFNVLTFDCENQHQIQPQPFGRRSN